MDDFIAPTRFEAEEQFAIGQPVPRAEDPVLLRGEGRYADDLSLPRQAYAAMVRSHLAHGVIRGIDTTAARAMPGVLADLHRGRSGAGRDRPAAAAPGHAQSRRHADADPDALRAAEGQGAACRRGGGRGDRRHPGSRQGRRRNGRGRDRPAAGGHRARRSRSPRRADPLRRGAEQCRLRLSFRRQRQGRRRLRRRRPCDPAPSAQQPHRRQCDGAALRDRRLRPGAPALDLACRQPGRLRLPQLPRPGPRRRPRPDPRRDRAGRRLVWHEAADLCRILLHFARGARIAPPGQMDRRPLRQLRVRHAWPRRRHERRAGARRRRKFPRRAARRATAISAPLTALPARRPATPSATRSASTGHR